MPLQRLLYLISYFILTLLLYAPILFDRSIPTDQRITKHLHDALSSNEVISSILLNVFGHIILLSLLFLAISLIARSLCSRYKISIIVSTWTVQIFSLLLLISLNAWLFPTSQFIAFYSNISDPFLGIISGVVILSGLFLVILDLTKDIRRKNNKLSPAIASAALVIVALLSSHLLTNSNATMIINRAEKLPNIIIIGVDSLSQDVLQRERERLPAISNLYQSLTRYSNTTTPLGRTFPAWMSILTGELPAIHGAHFNLTTPSSVDRDNLLSKELQRHGYQTIFALDERRFCNIDETYGFDKIIGPEAGAIDFVIQRFNDTPLTNLALQSNLSKWLFKYSYMNVASSVNYDSDSIIETIDKELTDHPQFIAVHLLSGHFPFKTKYPHGYKETTNTFYNRHISSLMVVDKQIQNLLTSLHNKGKLDNALLILLSDHGESLGEPEGIIHWKNESENPPSEIATYGHGANLLSKFQNNVVIAVSRYKNGKPLDQSLIKDKMVSLLDIKDTVLKYVTTKKPPHLPHRKCNITETGIRFTAAANYKSFDKAALAKEAANYYRITHEGRLEIKKDHLSHLKNSKDYAIRCNDIVVRRSTYSNKIETFLVKNGDYYETELNHDMAKTLNSYIDLSLHRNTESSKMVKNTVFYNNPPNLNQL